VRRVRTCKSDDDMPKHRRRLFATTPTELSARDGQPLEVHDRCNRGALDRGQSAVRGGQASSADCVCPRLRPYFLRKGAVSLMCFFCCLANFFSFGVCSGFFLLSFGG